MSDAKSRPSLIHDLEISLSDLLSPGPYTLPSKEILMGRACLMIYLPAIPRSLSCLGLYMLHDKFLGF